ncbi:MAG: hypothetical protein ACREEZ_03855, partial [Stellaceae bacterium]
TSSDSTAIRAAGDRSGICVPGKAFDQAGGEDYSGEHPAGKRRPAWHERGLNLGARWRKLVGLG